MFFLGMEASRALSTALTRREFDSKFAPPTRHALTISRKSLWKILLRFWSCAALACLMLCHLLCPAIHRTIAGVCGASGRAAAAAWLTPVASVLRENRKRIVAMGEGKNTANNARAKNSSGCVGAPNVCKLPNEGKLEFGNEKHLPCLGGSEPTTSPTNRSFVCAVTKALMTHTALISYKGALLLHSANNSLAVRSLLQLRGHHKTITFVQQ
jgi:hypothetical protein